MTIETDLAVPRQRLGLVPELLYTVDLTDTVDGTAVHTLLKPAELRIDLSKTPRHLDVSPILGLYHFDTALQYWEEVESHREGNDLVASISHFSNWGLSNDWGHDWVPTARTEAGQSDLLTGAATFSLPLEAPQGTNGVAPKLNLTYSSLATDAVNDGLVREYAPIDNESSGTQADWVGFGWGLGLGQITVEIRTFDRATIPIYRLELNGTSELMWCVGRRITTGDPTNYNNRDCYPENGQFSDNLEFRSERDSFLRIVRRQGGAQNTHQAYFEVWDKAGTYYRFGYNQDSEHIRGQNHHPSAWGLGLDRVVDTHNNRMELEYFEDQHVLDYHIDSQGHVTYDTRLYDRAAYPAVIRYTFTSSGESGKALGGDYHREVRFNEDLWRNSSGASVSVWTPGQTYWSTDNQPLMSRTAYQGPVVYWGKSNRLVESGFDWPLGSDNYMSTGGGSHSYYYVQRYKLDSISSYIKLGSAEPLLPYRKYKFSYNWVIPKRQQWNSRPASWPSDYSSRKLLLEKIQEYAGTGPASGFTKPLYPTSSTDTQGEPTYTFSYVKDDSNNPRANLTQARTALGGTVDYTYGSFAIADTLDSDTPVINRFHVVGVTTSAGTADPSVALSYEYGPARYFDTQDEFNEHLIGHDWTTVYEGPLAGCPGACTLDRSKNAVKHYFLTNQVAANLDASYPYRATSPFSGLTGNDIARWLSGREYQTDYIYGQTDGTANGNAVKRRIANLYTLSASVIQQPPSKYPGICDPCSNTPNRDVRFPQLIRTATYLEPGRVGAPVDIQAYSYNTQYGNLTDDIECVGGTDPQATCTVANLQFTRRTSKQFAILDQADASLMLRGQWSYIVDRVTFEGTHGGDTVTGTWWPNVTYYSYDSDTKGAAPTGYGELRWTRRIDCWQCSPETSSDTRYQYDSWGNVITETTYKQWGVNGSNHSGDAASDVQTLSREYDSTLHTFLTKVTRINTVTQTNVWEEAYYGSATDATTWREAMRRQRPVWTRDANDGAPDSTKTYLDFDDFGRLVKVTKPGDTTALPTEQYEYPPLRSAVPRFQVKATQRLDSSTTMLTRTFYDGMGRVMLVHNPQPNGTPSQAQAVSTFYDARGRKQKETIPYTVAALTSDTDAVTRDSSKAGTTYLYDQFGDATLTTQPDGVSSFMTPIREYRKTYFADRGATVWPTDQANPATNNASFETLGGTGGSCGTLPDKWKLITGSGACRTANGVDGRFAFQVQAGTTTTSATSFTPVGGGVSRSYTVSWLARGTATFSPVLRNTSSGALLTPSINLNYQLHATEWKLYHWRVDLSDSTPREIGFQVTSGTLEVDQVRVTDGDVRERLEQKDSLGNLDWVEERIEQPTLVDRIKTDYEYDILNRQRKVVDKQGNTTEFITYEQSGANVGKTRLTFRKEIDPDRGTWTYTFDPNGNAIKQQDPRSVVTTLCYDQLDRLTKKFYTDVPCASPSPDVAITYDTSSSGMNRVGRRYQMTTPSTSVTYDYDARGRVKNENRYVAGWPYLTSYQYYSNDQVKFMKYPDNEWIKNWYNSAGRLNKVCEVTLPNTNPTTPNETCVGGANTTYLDTFSYDEQGRPVDAALGNGVKSHHAYDPTTQRLSQLQTWVGGPTLDANLSYGYDTFGNITAINDAQDGTQNQTFQYDALNRLTATAGLYPQTFAYDDLGNLTKRDNQTYTYTSTKPHAVRRLGVDGGTDRFGYDAAGNMTARGSQTLAYDAEGRLTGVSGPTGSESYGYDGDGVLVRRTTTPASPTPSFTENFTTTTLSSANWATVGTYAGNLWGGSTSHGSIATWQANGEVYRKATLTEGRVVRFAFGFGSNTSGASLGLETGDWYAGTYHRFGVWQRDGQLVLHLFRNSQELQRAVLMPSVEANVWYVMEMMVDDAGGFKVSVWKESDSSTRYEMRYEMPRTTGWRFHAWSSGALLSLDDYSEATLNLGTSDARLIGKHYEYDPALSRQTKRYYAGGTLLATRVTQLGCPGCEELTYVQGDHLGSTSTLTNGSGNVVARERYSAFGERRRGETYLVTDQLYTGQRLNVLSNLYHYSDGTSAGRFYDPLLARFVQADSVTPGNTSIALNRYAYANNNPMRYNDPSGHMQADMAYAGGAGGNSPVWIYENAEDLFVDLRIRDRFAQTWFEANRDYSPLLDDELNSPTYSGYTWPYPEGLRKTISDDLIASRIMTFGTGDESRGTVAVTFGGVAFAGNGVVGQVGFAVDTHESFGVYASGGWGGFTSMGHAIGLGVSVTNARSLDDLNGISIQTGGNGGEAVGATFEHVIMPSSGAQGINVGFGETVKGPWPFEVHTTVTNTRMWQFNLYDALGVRRPGR